MDLDDICSPVAEADYRCVLLLVALARHEVLVEEQQQLIPGKAL
jgi:hypothetical protein